jgi:hypothetical protein
MGRNAIRGRSIMKKTPTRSKRNSLTKTRQIRKRESSRTSIKRTATCSKRISDKVRKGTRKTAKIECDLEKRRMHNHKRIDFERTLERFVLDLNVDWAEFHGELFQALENVVCNHDHTECRRILTSMSLDGVLIAACLSYFPFQGGHCDCEVALNVDMTHPRPLVDFGCTDCGHDYDEQTLRPLM